MIATPRIARQTRAGESRQAPIDVLRLRAECRALLWAEQLIETIPDAVDPLRHFAVDSGLVDEIGQDAVQKILVDAFRPYRESAA
jgi:hypothetical protein